MKGQKRIMELQESVATLRSNHNRMASIISLAFFIIMAVPLVYSWTLLPDIKEFNYANTLILFGCIISLVIVIALSLWIFNWLED